VYVCMCIIVSKTPIETKSNIGKTNSYASINQLMGINERKNMKNKVSIAFIFPRTLIHHTQTPHNDLLPQFVTASNSHQLAPKSSNRRHQWRAHIAVTHLGIISFPSLFFSLSLSFFLSCIMIRSCVYIYYL